MTTKTVEERFDTLMYPRFRDKDRLLEVSHKIDHLRERISKKIRHSDRTTLLRRCNDSR